MCYRSTRHLKINFWGTYKLRVNILVVYGRRMFSSIEKNQRTSNLNYLRPFQDCLYYNVTEGRERVLQ